METVKSIYELFKEKGDEKYMIDEPITQIDHAYQTYETMKKHMKKHMKDQSNDAELLVASAFHDIGHFLVDHPKGPKNGDDRHEHIGAIYLRNLGFPERVCEIVKLHTTAKRYLLTMSEAYANNLSEASKQSAKLQGGKMSITEILQFQQNPYFNDALLLRYCDDKGKNVKKDKDTLNKLFRELQPLILQML